MSPMDTPVTFLLPRKLAAAASTASMQQAEKRVKQLAVEQEKLDAAAQQIAGTVTGSAIVIMVKAGDEGRLFGSVTATDVAEAVNERAGTKLTHRQVLSAGRFAKSAATRSRSA